MRARVRVVECERAREYSSARGLACNAREYYTITTRVTCESLASHSRVSRESLASDTRVLFNLLVDSTAFATVIHDTGSLLGQENARRRIVSCHKGLFATCF